MAKLAGWQWVLDNFLPQSTADGLYSAKLHAARHAAGGPDAITPASIGAVSLNHASRHAAGQPDAITPASIGAVNGVATQLPGGWATMDANAMLAAGRYALYAGSSLNVPSAGGGVVGILEVMPRTSTSSDQIYQRWTVMGTASGNPIGIWVRSTYNGGTTWGTWERVDNNALKPSDIGAADLYATPMTAAGTNVNTLITPGTYLVSQSAVNTPGSYTGHIVTFNRKDAPRYTHQRFTALTGTSPGMEWTRTSLDGGITWTAWILVGGADTGWRSTTAFLSPTFVLDKAQIRRVGNMVYVNLQATAMPTVNSYVASGMPAGFRPSSSGVAFPITAYSPSAATASLGHFGLNSSGTTFLRPTGVAGSLYFECSYLTDNAWPTTLPGSPA